MVGSRPPGRAPLRGVAQLLVGLVVLAQPAAPRAQTATSTSTARTAREALAMAEAAFEYRDFDQVVRALDPWVHPPRIQDREAMITARRLLGVALHVRGDVRGAREEFAQLLLLDPDHRLDPFVIPPQIIVTFEDVKRLLPTPPEPSPPPRAELRLPPRVLTFAPLGLPQGVLDEPALGVGLGALQAVGLALNVWAFQEAQGLPRGPERDRWVATQFGGLALLGVAYGASVLLGNLRLDELRRLPPAAVPVEPRP